MMLPPALLTPASESGGIDVDAILATGGAVRVGGFNLTIGTTLLSAMANGLTVANTEPTSWTIIVVATSIASGSYDRIASDPDGENLVLVEADDGSMFVLGMSGALPASPVVAGVSQVDGGSVTARANGSSLSGFSPPGLAVPGVGAADYELAGSGSSQMAFLVFPSALTADELDAIYAATVFP